MLTDLGFAYACGSICMASCVSIPVLAFLALTPLRQSLGKIVLFHFFAIVLISLMFGMSPVFSAPGKTYEDALYPMALMGVMFIAPIPTAIYATAISIIAKRDASVMKRRDSAER